MRAREKEEEREKIGNGREKEIDRQSARLNWGCIVKLCSFGWG